MSAVKGKNSGPSRQEIERLVAWRNASTQDGGTSERLNCDTRWEEIRAVSFDPRRLAVQAIVRINRATGFNQAADEGSSQHIRFFVDTGAGFQDIGMSSFRVADVADCVVPEHPLYYLVNKPIPERLIRRGRRATAPATVRAVLSWHLTPSSNPDDLPVFGNCVESAVQMEAISMANASPVLTSYSLPVLPADNVVLTLPDVKQAASSEPDLQNVPEHRRCYPAVQQLFQENAAAGKDTSLLKAAGVSLQQVLAVAAAPKASTDFEELTCIGLCTSTDSVGGTILLKQKRGYSLPGGTSGKEYVAFWADCNNDGIFEEYLGTGSVEVRDADGSSSRPPLAYAVSVPVPDSIRLLRSRGIFKSVRIRGVLSWAVPPSTTDPEVFNNWGNRVEAQVRLSPTVAIPDEGRTVDPDFLTWLAQLRPSRSAHLQAHVSDTEVDLGRLSADPEPGPGLKVPAAEPKLETTNGKIELDPKATTAG